MTKLTAAQVDILKKATSIAGALMDDGLTESHDTMSVSERIQWAANWSNLGTDGDLTQSDRNNLRKLAERAKKLEK